MTIPQDNPFLPMPLSWPLRVSGLSSRKATPFDLQPDSETRASIARYLGITSVSEMRFKGSVAPVGRHDMELKGDLTAVVEQPCSVTLVPVLTPIGEPVALRYVADMEPNDAAEMEMPGDVGSEPLGEIIDPGHVAVEALALALPIYPRAPDAELTDTDFAPPGVAPLSDDDLRPFAGLSALKARLEVGEPPEPPDVAAKTGRSGKSRDDK